MGQSKGNSAILSLRLRASTQTTGGQILPCQGCDSQEEEKRPRSTPRAGSGHNSNHIPLSRVNSQHILRDVAGIKTRNSPHIKNTGLTQSTQGFDSCVCASLCSTLSDSTDYSTPCSFVHGIFPARIQEWVAISSFRGSSQARD